MAESTFAKICEILKEQDGVTEELTPETTFEEAGIESGRTRARGGFSISAHHNLRCALIF